MTEQKQSKPIYRVSGIEYESENETEVQVRASSSESAQRKAEAHGIKVSAVQVEEGTPQAQPSPEPTTSAGTASESASPSSGSLKAVRLAFIFGLISLITAPLLSVFVLPFAVTGLVLGIVVWQRGQHGPRRWERPRFATFLSGGAIVLAIIAGVVQGVLVQYLTNSYEAKVTAAIDDTNQLIDDAVEGDQVDLDALREAEQTLAAVDGLDLAPSYEQAEQLRHELRAVLNEEQAYEVLAELPGSTLRDLAGGQAMDEVNYLDHEALNQAFVVQLRQHPGRIDEALALQRERHKQKVAELTEKYDSYASTAESRAEALVVQKLTAPSTADIQRSEVVEQQAHWFLVNVVVDADNAFGATVRNGFLVVLKYDEEEDGWYLHKQYAVQSCSRPPSELEVQTAKTINQWPSISEVVESFSEE